MPQRKILLDTNAYLRLAQTIRPLLGKPFGKENFTLYIHKRFDDEVGKNQRLKTSFYWIYESEYIENRKKRLTLSAKEKKDIESAFDFIWEFQNEFALGLSRIDIYCISTSLTLEIPLVTDDQNMIKTCKEYGVVVYSSLRLLKLMFDENYIDIEKVKEITDYWKYENDLPANFKKEMKTFFGKLL